MAKCRLIRHPTELRAEGPMQGSCSCFEVSVDLCVCLCVCVCLEGGGKGINDGGQNASLLL